MPHDLTRPDFERMLGREWSLVELGRLPEGELTGREEDALSIARREAVTIYTASGTTTWGSVLSGFGIELPSEHNPRGGYIYGPGDSDLTLAELRDLHAALGRALAAYDGR
jgi:hypothetical protein